jgi:hypothetical protein
VKRGYDRRFERGVRTIVNRKEEKKQQKIITVGVIKECIKWKAES